MAFLSGSSLIFAFCLFLILNLTEAVEGTVSSFLWDLHKDPFKYFCVCASLLFTCHHWHAEKDLLSDPCSIISLVVS